MTLTRKIFLIIFAATLAFSVPPIATYAWARLSGSLPSEEVWDKTGGNHGPWWGSFQELIITFSLLALSALPWITFFITGVLVSAANTGKLKRLLSGLCLIALQIFLFYFVLLRIFWTTD